MPLVLTLLLAACGRPELSDVAVEPGLPSESGPGVSLGVAQPAYTSPEAPIGGNGAEPIPQIRTVMALNPGA